jgi:hypothetical protein
MHNIVKLGGKKGRKRMKKVFPLFSLSFVKNKKIEMLFQFRMNSINLPIRKAD